MNCSEVKERISAYYDGELPADSRTAVEAHLATCEDCARELEKFRQLSDLSKELTHPEAPAHIWRQLEEQLGLDDRARSKRPARLDGLGLNRKRLLQVGVAIAVVTLIVVVHLTYKTFSHVSRDEQFALVFRQYLKEFRDNPQAAQQILLGKYDGQAVRAERAARFVGYRPAVAGGMPEGYSVVSTYVMKMPCCTCVQCLCQRRDGTAVVIFEHDDEEPNWFGNRPERKAVVSDHQCSIVELDDRFAASWQRGKRQMTIVGLRDAKEIEHLIAWFENSSRIVPQ